MLPGPPPRTYYVDNKAPAVFGTVAFNENFDQQWISSTFDFAAAISGSPEALGQGSGYNPDADKAFLYDGTLTAPPGPVPTCHPGRTVQPDDPHRPPHAPIPPLGSSLQIAAPPYATLEIVTLEITPKTETTIDGAIALSETKVTRTVFRQKPGPPNMVCL